MSKKLWIGFIVVFVLGSLIDFVVNMYLMTGVYEQTKALWRPMEEMKMGVIYLTQAIFSFFFVLIFSKGYEGKGWVEGLRYGFYTAMMISVPSAYMTYATMPVPYSLALQWFLYGLVKMLVLGVVLTMIYGKEKTTAVKRPAAVGATV